MNRPVYFLEFKTSSKVESLKDLVERALNGINEPDSRLNPEHWAVYSNDRRMDSWNKKLRPKSKIVLAAQFSPQASLELAFESRKIVVLDKPAGLPTQKTLKKHEDNLYDQARLYYLQKKGFPRGLPYVGLHHRLDRGTRGLVLMTLQRQVNKEVSELFKNHRIFKEYIAYTEYGAGELKGHWKQIDNIRRGPAQKKKFFFEVAETGDQAITEFEVVEKKQDTYYKILCRPLTGRTHQLRVQLSHKGYPILGDSTYGQKKSAKHLMLQAHLLRFQLGGEKIVVQSKYDLDVGDL